MCMGKVLVAYATKTGTTKEAAEEIAAVLQSLGIDAEAKPIGCTKSLTEYSGFVVGSPINGMKWMPEAAAFVQTNSETLRSRPCALFTVSYMHEYARKRWAASIEKDIAIHVELAAPKATAIFGGRIPNKIPTVFRFMFGLPADIGLDSRKPGEVRSWAEGLAGSFGFTA
jgi:menaquinone-dependent protoporphyrinogen oxidase